ncbi:LegC family aminotransferase [Lacrimispora celerecrescens]|uniref:Perosamine synthetase n=2 Tax=Bacillota TaxID=1239 RepID=A0A2M8Z0Z0_9FIRM|nr:LegC family aminotransferase [Lacrimispora celerecrescens]PJJ27103.1 perosamine synthetase [[Clostridium] celerecrescens 18A]
MIPLSVPNLAGNEKKYILDALDSGWISTAGCYVARFEQDMASYLNVPGAAAVQSGTAAIHLAMLLSGVKPGQEVIVPTLTFIASVNPAAYIGAAPVFMDCDDSLNIDCDKLEDFLKKECVMTSSGLINKSTNRIITAVVVVHIFGNMADMERLKALTGQYGLKLIEDAAEALGTCYNQGTYHGQFAGTIGDFGAYSFNGNKIITTGGGGLLTAKDGRDLERAKYLAAQAKDDPFHYTHNEVGYNYRMTNLQAALGVGQLECLEDFIRIKEINYEYYGNAITSTENFELLKFNQKARNNRWFYSLFIKNDGLDRNAVIKQLKEKDIETRPIWQLAHTQKMYENCQAYYIEKAPFYWNRVINIPCSTSLLKKDMDHIIQALNCI